MAVNIRRARIKHECSSCGSKDELFEIGIGNKCHKTLNCLCAGCMHELLKKLITVGGSYEV